MTTASRSAYTQKHSGRFGTRLKSFLPSVPSQNLSLRSATNTKPGSESNSTKVYTVLDSVRMHRSEGAMVRITTSVDDSDAAALQTAINQATEVAASSSTILPEFIPD